jgi:hypothetical protein
VARKLGIRLWIMLRDQIELPRVLSSWTEAAEKQWCLCGDTRNAVWCEKSPTG